MNERRRVVLLILIMSGVALCVAGISLSALYGAAIEEERARLVETALIQARLMEAVARFNARYSTDGPGSAFDATIGQVREAHERFPGFGKTGEFTLARREGNQIVFLLSQRHADLDDPKPVPFASELAEPMRRALSGQSGTLVGVDYRGQRVLAAYEPVGKLNLGIVAKIDLSEVRAPFIRAGTFAGGGAVALIFFGTVLFLRIGNPMIRHLEESVRKYRGLFDSAADALLLSDQYGVILDANPAACSAFGYSRKEFIGRSAAELIHPDHGVPFAEAREKLAHKDFVFFDSVAVRKDETSFPVEVNLSPMTHEGRKGALAVIRDVTERKRAQTALEQAHRELEKRVQDRTAELSEANKTLESEIMERERTAENLRLDESRLSELLKLSQMEDANRKQVADFTLEALVKLTKSQIGFLGFMNDDETIMNIHAWSEVVMKECAVRDEGLVFAMSECGLWGEPVRQRRPIVVNDYAALETWKKGYPEGHIPIRRFLGIPVFDDDRIIAVAAAGNKEDEYNDADVRQLTLLTTMMWKLIQRKQAKEELSRSEARLKEAQRVARMGSWEWDMATNHLHWSDEIYRIFGLDPQEFGATYDAFLASVHPDDRALVQERVDAAVHRDVEYDVEHRILLPDGEIRYVHEQGEVTRDAQGAPVSMIGVVIDVTDRRRAEEQSRQHQVNLAHVARLSTLGEMGSAIGHELNQPLTAILSYTQACLRMMKSETGDSDAILTAMEQVAAQAKRAGEIIRRLRNFSRKREPHRSTMDINDVVRESAGFLATEAVSCGIRVQLKLADHVPAVLGDTVEVEQVVVNLMRNAIEAMEDTPEDERELIIQTSVTEGGAIKVAVSDAGSGLPSMLPGGVDQLFQAFYTTKEEGMGIGLSISQSIIEACGGRLWATDNPGGGATFGFTLPSESNDEV